ncbi:hypothetical protein L0128_07225 [candidate division KSB1 bacterium]|nr:hypothetical protein [candidate division KSB1 bacterium]
MNPHLTDDRLQDYLDGNVALLAPAMLSHLKNCTHCQGRLQQYRQLFAELKAAPTVDYPADFSAQIIAQLPATKPAFNLSDWLIPILGLTGAIISTGVMVYLGKIQLNLLVVTKWFPTGHQILTYLLNFGDHLKASLHLNFFLLGLATLTLFLTALLDRWLHRRLLFKKPSHSKFQV